MATQADAQTVMQDGPDIPPPPSPQSCMSIASMEGALISMDIDAAAPGCTDAASANATTRNTSRDLAQFRIRGC
jgi:hypothetical protein